MTKYSQLVAATCLILIGLCGNAEGRVVGTEITEAPTPAPQTMTPTGKAGPIVSNGFYDMNDPEVRKTLGLPTLPSPPTPPKATPTRKPVVANKPTKAAPHKHTEPPRVKPTPHVASKPRPTPKPVAVVHKPTPKLVAKPTPTPKPVVASKPTPPKIATRTIIETKIVYRNIYVPVPAKTTPHSHRSRHQTVNHSDLTINLESQGHDSNIFYE